MRAEENGVTVAEVLVAVMVFTVGVLALVGATSATSRMLARGRHATVAAAGLASRIEELHRIAAATVPACSAPEWRSDSALQTGVSVRWEVLDDAGAARRVRLVLRQPASTLADTVMTAVLCPVT